MKKLSIIFYFIVGIILFRTVIFPGKQQESEPILSEPINMPATYGERGSDNSWPNLADRNFSVAANQLAKNYYLVVDGSGSMSDAECSAGKQKLDAAKTAISGFVQSLPGNANIGLYIFDARSDSERIAIAANNKNQILKEISAARAGGGTPLANSIASGVSSLSQQARLQLGYGEYHLVVVTDGHASSRFNTQTEVEKLLVNTPIVLHTIGFCIGENHALNNPGRTVYKPADSPEALAAGLQEVLAEAPNFDAGTFSEIQ